jgi:hypothetical protein
MVKQIDAPVLLLVQMISPHWLILLYFQVCYVKGSTQLTPHLSLASTVVVWRLTWAMFSSQVHSSRASSKSKAICTVLRANVTLVLRRLVNLDGANYNILIKCMIAVLKHSICLPQSDICSIVRLIWHFNRRKLKWVCFSFVNFTRNFQLAHWRGMLF